MEAAIKRILPHSTEAEQAVIGAMLMNKDAIITASEIVTGGDFYQSAYGILFDSMVELFQAGKPVDLITLQAVSYTHLDVYKRQGRFHVRKRVRTSGCDLRGRLYVL